MSSKNVSGENDSLVLERFLLFRLNRLSESMSLKFAQYYQKDYGMTCPEWRVLAVLGEHDELTSTQICKITTLHKTKVSRAVKSLSERGWLKKKRGKKDRRVEFLQLTLKGQRVYKHLAHSAIEFEAKVLSPMSPSDCKTIQKALVLLEALGTFEDGRSQ